MGTYTTNVELNCAGSGCLSANVREDKITELLLDLIADKLFSDKAIKKMYKLAETKRQNGDLEKARHLHRELADNKGQQRRLIEMVRDDLVPMNETKRRHAPTESRRRRVRSQVGLLRRRNQLSQQQ